MENEDFTYSFNEDETMEYRLMRLYIDGRAFLALYQVVFDKDGNAIDWESVCNYYNSVNEYEVDWYLMGAAFFSPILCAETGKELDPEDDEDTIVHEESPDKSHLN